MFVLSHQLIWGSLRVLRKDLREKHISISAENEHMNATEDSGQTQLQLTSD